MVEFEGSIVPADVQRANVEALGEPGQRRFRLLVFANNETTILWMEKQQVDVLGRALEQILIQLPAKGPVPSSEPDSEPSFDLSSRNQFRVGRLEIGYDQERDGIVVIAYDIESGDEAAPGLVCRFSRTQAGELSDESARVVAAGRPRCVLCGEPMDAGQHACAEQNGHLADEFRIIDG